MNARDEDVSRSLAVSRTLEPVDGAAATIGELDGDALAREIERYLAAVDAFRALGREPRWRSEDSSCHSLVSMRTIASNRNGR